MIGKLIGALVGREIDRRDGQGGMKGALLGAASAGILRRAGPIGLLLGGAYVAKKALDRRKADRARTNAMAGDVPPSI
ncbi:hypothetical protein [Rhizorhabdus dicambivorans]|uniref:Uncharacterized protein n=1 Tax=Rhizorhabdus dicambivorans TaxID=1850238 RepID=A0A2A4G093_9SPHN|nr:hypothetical protein [Rhizorhabdus dicambivorans]ATE63215.1 hypothetical protein CMV14_01395 [Rhizorhabdus dicambivorans]PCE43429.1 hypothetical protein COO09_03715 [Rhizorhabdus dicambivorans]